MSAKFHENLLREKRLKFLYGFGAVLATASIYTKQNYFPSKKKKRKNLKRQKFEKFASIEYNGQNFMTPKDFLDNIVFDVPRPRIKQKLLNPEQLAIFMKDTPKISKDNLNFFAKLDEKGLISYIEYLFLLSLVTKSQEEFNIPFQVMDFGENGTLSFQEYHQFCSLAAKKKPQNDLPEKSTLIVHFFGFDRNHLLNFENFSSFVSNFQKEVLLTEFHEYSRGQEKISSLDFVSMILKYTKLTPEEHKNLIGKLHPDLYFTFEEMETFNRFLTKLDDFVYALSLFRTSVSVLSFAEFKRAAKVCMNGEELPQNMIDVIFNLFIDEGQFELEDFIVIMRNRRNRKINPEEFPHNSWLRFKHCFKRILTE